MKKAISERKQDLVNQLRDMADFIEKGIALKEDTEEFFKGLMFVYTECLKEDRQEAETKNIEKKQKIEKAIDEAKKLNVDPIFEEIAKKILENWIEYDKAHNIDKYGHKIYYHEIDIIKENVKKVNTLFKNMMNRVTKKTGEITSYKNLSIEQGNSIEGIAINGIIEGTNGNAHIESIIAGGYNIQKLHIRVLVK